jgi:outer membrane protein OmpA-like peptidoglycan-associated protein
MKTRSLWLALIPMLLPLHAGANVVGAATQNFNPTTDGLDYVTVHSSKTLKPGLINLGLFFNYAVNSLPYSDPAAQERTKFNDKLTSSDVNIGLGLTDRIDVGLSIPAVLSQSVSDSTGERGEFASSGLTETRINGKWRLLGDDDGGFAAVASANFNRIKNDPFAGSGAGPTYNLEFVVDRAFANGVNAAFNVGHRWRSPGTAVAGSSIEPMRNQFIASVGVSRLLQSTDTKIIGELFGAFPSQGTGSNPTRNQTSAEALVGLKQDFSNELAAHVGGGAAILSGVASPDWRLYAGLNYTFGPAWKQEPQTVSRVEPRAQTEVFRVGNILFKFNSAEMINDYKIVLAGLIQELRRKPFKQLTIEGHTDSVGKVAYNVNLSQRRADAIRDYLISEGIAGDKIKTVGVGPSRPIADNGNYQGRQANRRVEFLIDR